MEEGSPYKLKISIDNTNSDDDDSDSGSDDFKNNRRPKKSLENNSGDEVFKDRESDNDEAISIDAATNQVKVSEQKIKTYKNKAGTFVVGFDPTSEECRERQEQRAKRFGDTVPGAPLTDEAIQKLYESLGVSLTSDKEDGGITRFEAIHVHGVDEMSTSRVFDYFGEFAPAAIEWIDDTSCNVVWMDRIMAARAMLKMSTEAATANDAGADASEMDVQRDGISAAKEGEPASTVVSAKESEETRTMEEEDDDLNLLSDDDVAKLSHSTVTAEENRAEVAKRRSSMAEVRDLTSKAKSDEPGQEEDMDVDEVTDSAASRVTEQREPSHPVRRSSVAAEVDPNANRKRRQRIWSEEEPVEVPPGKWRIGLPQQRAKRLFMRFATKADIKQAGAGKRSKYYQKYGNPNFGGLKGIISGSRKRKMFSKRYLDELEEARKAIEEAKWKRGIPDETKFDQHVEEAVSKRSKVAREPVELVYSEDESNDDSQNELVVEHPRQDARRPAKKRFMKMHADEVQSRSLSERLGARSHTSSSSDVRDRLGLSTRSLRTDRDSCRRNDERDADDLRNRLSRK